jgi:hypothetical protein
MDMRNAETDDLDCERDPPNGADDRGKTLEALAKGEGIAYQRPREFTAT